MQTTVAPELEFGTKGSEILPWDRSTCILTSCKLCFDTLSLATSMLRKGCHHDPIFRSPALGSA